MSLENDKSQKRNTDKKSNQSLKITDTTSRLVIFCFLLLFLFCSWPTLMRPLSGDETIPFLNSWLMREGYGFYSDFWLDDKPPGLTIFYLLASWSKDNAVNFFAIRFFSIMYQLATCVAFYFLSKKIFEKRLALVLLPAFILAYTNGAIEGQYANADNFTALLIILSYLSFFNGNLLESGLLGGICFLFKQNTCLLMVPISITYLIRARFSRQSLFMVAFQFFIFVAPSVVVLFAAFLNNGHWIYLNQTFLRRIHSHLLHKDYNLFWHYVPPLAKQFFPLIVFAIAGWFISVWKLKNEIRGSNLSLTVVLWGIFSILSVWVGGYFFPHYFLEIVPFILVATGIAFSKLVRIPTMLRYLRYPELTFGSILFISLVFTLNESPLSQAKLLNEIIGIIDCLKMNESFRLSLST